MKPKTALFILSLGHAGSTVVGCVLGSHSRALHIGEVIAPLRKRQPLRCRFCWERPCPIWGGVLDDDFVRRCTRSAQGAARSRLRRAWHALGRPLSGARPPPGALHQRLLEAHPEVELVIDGSKRIHWAEWNRRAEGFRSRFLLVHRDLRALVASARRASGVDVESATRRAVASARSLAEFAEALPAGSVHTLRYEAFSSDPEAACRNLCADLELPFEAHMLRYHEFPHHVVGGNLGPILQSRAAQGLDNAGLLELLPEHLRAHYLGSGRRLATDERWKNELGPAELRAFAALGAEMNRRLGYDA